MYSTEDGFTLIECLIAVSIMGILASIAVPNFTNQVNAQEDRNVKAALTRVAQDCSEAIVFEEDYQLPEGLTGECDATGGSITAISKSGTSLTIAIDADGSIVNQF